MPWADLGPAFTRSWGRPGGRYDPEHLEILGPTGSGKSWFQAAVLEERARRRHSHILVICTKPADDTLKSLGWPVIKRWPPNADQKQVLIWPKSGLSVVRKRQQRDEIVGVLEKIWVPNSNRIVVFDEISYLQHELGLEHLLRTYYREARSQGITIVANTQRPQSVTRFMHSESKWTVAFAPSDEDDAERVAQVLGNKKYYRDVLLELDSTKHEFLLVQTTSREAYISSIDNRVSPRSQNRHKVLS